MYYKNNTEKPCKSDSVQNRVAERKHKIIKLSRIIKKK